MKYKNKYFREVLEKDLKDSALGVNIHCKEDGIHITVPPYPITGDDFTDDYASEILREDHDTQVILDRIKKITKDFHINIELEKAIYGDNIKIKLNVYDK